MFRKKFNKRTCDPVPTRSSVNLWIKSFRETGSAAKRPLPGKRATVNILENREHVCQVLLSSPNRLRVKHTQFLISRILTNLQFHPYKILITEELKDTDYEARLKFARRMKTALKEGEVSSDFLLISDEAHFYLNETVNKQNCRYYATQNPYEVVKCGSNEIALPVICQRKQENY